MKRYFLLIAYDLLLQIGFGPIVLVDGNGKISENVRWSIVCLLNPLAQPTAWATACWPRFSPPLIVAAAIAGPFLWAAIVELFLRYFVDPTKDDGSE